MIGCLDANEIWIRNFSMVGVRESTSPARPETIPVRMITNETITLMRDPRLVSRLNLADLLHSSDLALSSLQQATKDIAARFVTNPV